MKRFLKALCFVFCIVISIQAAANITLPKIFTNNMVLQRDRPLKIWGWAAKGETVTIKFNGQKVKSKAAADGSWIVTLDAMAYGGPFEMSITGKNNITLKNILIGDVYICSGQSNMEWEINNTNNAAKEIAESNHAGIRLFTVRKSTAFQPQKDFVGGEWLECNPQNIGAFSAVAYFFGRKLNSDLNIPIGLINTSWGGTNIQTWISWDVMSKKGNNNKEDVVTMEKERRMIEDKLKLYSEALKNEKSDGEKWYDPASGITGWKPVTLPQLWERTEIGNADGIIWFKKEFELPAGMETKGIVLNLGPIDDIDVTYVNGIKVGNTNMYSTDRIYRVDASVLKKGKNTIIIKVIDTGGGGGLYGSPDKLFVDADGQKISLAGEWEYKPSVITTQFGIKIYDPNSFPSQLYNAMIAPITNYAIKGGIWYQGEANTWEAYRYRTLFPEMINDWRSKWGYAFPFFWVQLANFMAVRDTPVPSEWAELREAQNMTLSMPATGQAVIIDIGEAKDIHPRNKQDVGYRLALAAEKVAYEKNIIFSGPVYQSMKVEGNKVICSFSSIGGGLMATKDKYGYLKGFTIAGNDQKFTWAKAYIEGDKVVVYSDEVAAPAAVRYAWADNPDDANLYNKEGLPASPFRTDSWKGVTVDKY